MSPALLCATHIIRVLPTTTNDCHFSCNRLSQVLITYTLISVTTDSQLSLLENEGIPNMATMAVTIPDDELFTRAISSYREAFWVQLAHLPESERNQLWSQCLSQFLSPTASANYFIPTSGPPVTNENSIKSMKRTRQDATPRTLPFGSGLPAAKRRVTVR